ncbi:MAG: hypothetical protein AMDU4_FER2C00152G0001 [Ferroplasma sp. Type II]|nr:MAG: hypothetical protein AMDU4_FER2C00152G0001 [Ferroplasma sp. Type II]
MRKLVLLFSCLLFLLYVENIRFQPFHKVILLMSLQLYLRFLKVIHKHQHIEGRSVLPLLRGSKTSREKQRELCLYFLRMFLQMLMKVLASHPMKIEVQD